MTKQIGIIGGGAAGFFAAIQAASLAGDTCQVTLLEATNRYLTKVKISGGGRCNVTHNCFDPREFVKNYPRGHKELLGPFHRFQAKDTVTWFKERGVVLKAEADGRMFPHTDNSQTVIDCLMQQVKENHVALRPGMFVEQITCREDYGKRFLVQCKSGQSFEFDRLMLATGSMPQGHKLAMQLNHTITKLAPSLFTFVIDDPRLRDLAGVSFECVHLRLQVGAKKFEQKGPLLITHWGLSGPGVLKLSAWAARELFETNYQANLTITFLPDRHVTQIEDTLVKLRESGEKKQLKTLCPFEIPKRYWQQLLHYLKISEDMPWNQISKKHMQSICQELNAGLFQVAGKGVFKEEFVTCGGVATQEVDFRTMESKVCPGLYFGGEILNIDGITGGFNFQNAWTTGFIAGNHMVTVT